MKKWEKTKIMLMCLVLVLSSFCLSFAASEVEPNEKTSEATYMSVNTTYTGNSDDDYDDDYYYFELTSPGSVVINFKHDKLKTTKDVWSVNLYDENENKIVDRDIQGNEPDFSLPAQGLDVGTYYIDVEATYNSDPTAYSITALFSQSDYWEKEINDKTETSTLLQCNTSYKGTSCNDYDEDYYYFELTSPGSVTINFKHEKLKTANEPWKVSLYDEDENRIVDDYIQGNKINVSLPTQGLDAGTYYIDVEATYNSDSTEYSLEAKYKMSNSWEKEINDKTATATLISTNKTYYGTSCNDYDDDYFSFYNKKKHKVTITFSHSKLKTSNEPWKVYLIDSKGNIKKTVYIKGNKKKTSFSSKLSKGTYYIDVEATYNSSPIKYSLKVK